VKVSEEDYLMHYGILRKSGRYPWGSGENPNQRSRTFLDITEEMRREGMTDPQIAKAITFLPEAQTLQEHLKLAQKTNPTTH